MTEDLESGAPLMGRMAFDIEKARQTCEKLQEYYDSDWHPQSEPIIVSDSARLLPAALAEIERLTLSLDELKKQLKFDRQSLDCYRSQNIDYTMEKAAQAKRIAELEKALVEERAATVAYENNMQLCECKESAFCQARQQLHREGLL